MVNHGVVSQAEVQKLLNESMVRVDVVAEHFDKRPESLNLRQRIVVDKIWMAGVLSHLQVQENETKDLKM